MKHIRLSDLRTDGDIARAFGCTVADIRRLVSPQSSTRLLYHEIRLPKKGRRRLGQVRIVHKALDRTLRLFQKNIATVLASQCEFPDCVQGFVANRSIATNAKQHLARPLVLTADIEGFFEAISSAHVREVFARLGCVPAVAERLAALTTLNGHLVQGSNASPVLANLVCAELDGDLRQLAERLHCTYTRYADDITISGDDGVPTVDQVCETLNRHGFSLRDGEVRVQRRGRKQYVTGLSVFDSQRPRIPRVVKRRLRLILHYAGKYGFDGHFDHIGLEDGSERAWEQRRLEGWVQFIRGIEPRFGRKLAGDLEDARR